MEMNIDTVIKGLKHCKITCEGVSHNPCNGCPYQGTNDCADRLKDDALALLEKQQMEIDERTKEASGYAERLTK